MSKRLNMKFNTDSNKEVTIGLANPKESLTRADVTAVMDKIIAKSFFLSGDSKLTSIADVTVKSTEETPLA